MALEDFRERGIPQRRPAVNMHGVWGSARATILLRYTRKSGFWVLRIIEDHREQGDVHVGNFGVGYRLECNRVECVALLGENAHCHRFGACTSVTSL